MQGGDIMRTQENSILCSCHIPSNEMRPIWRLSTDVLSKESAGYAFPKLSVALEYFIVWFCVFFLRAYSLQLFMLLHLPALHSIYSLEHLDFQTLIWNKNEGEISLEPQCLSLRQAQATWLGLQSNQKWGTKFVATILAVFENSRLSSKV